MRATRRSSLRSRFCRRAKSKERQTEHTLNRSKSRSEKPTKSQAQISPPSSPEPRPQSKKKKKEDKTPIEHAKTRPQDRRQFGPFRYLTAPPLLPFFTSSSRTIAIGPEVISLPFPPHAWLGHVAPQCCSVAAAPRGAAESVDFRVTHHHPSEDSASLIGLPA
ncbi:hypothetical protein SODALDRAFT_106162 [Sodiomyces alkalinus F11]|uniref:Uncharacterized protein n=1 Tax=Sodiomyces alkalinus (strain CBS 110278 / VKM F-3762 / F11) TaxID=1314773 RepID=A0A3N2Q281_SODAK|nr:hypothetical protein SODALDRAFT_106162 [Sodiomyces alkalinus F11]ROT40857.1 hypothetical protein SODALDRAFT_106162 [Sodiomyces alkalinus F11]